MTRLLMLALLIVAVTTPLFQPWNTTNTPWFFGSAILEGFAVSALVILALEEWFL